MLNKRSTIDKPPAPSNATNADETCDRICNIEAEVVDKDGATRPEIQIVSSNAIAKARQITIRAAQLDEPTQHQAIIEAVRIIYPYHPRDGQREALHRLIYQKKDLILIAKTSFGKSMILQAVSKLLDKAITLILIPLQQIGEEQMEYIRQIGGQPCLLNTTSISDSILDEITAGKYTHIMVSPELAISERFRHTALISVFQKRLALVVVDGAHLVHIRGKKFRTAYALLNQLRILVGGEIPWFACSATLDRHTLASSKRNIQFHDDVKVQRTSINRPEIVIRTGIMKLKIGGPDEHIVGSMLSCSDHRVPRYNEAPGGVLAKCLSAYGARYCVVTG